MSKEKKEGREGGRRKIKRKERKEKETGREEELYEKVCSVYPCRSELIHIVPIFSGTHKNLHFSQVPYLYDEDNNTKYLNRWFHALNDIIYRKNLDVQFSLATLCNPMDCSTPGLPVHHQLLEFTQTHVH